MCQYDALRLARTATGKEQACLKLTALGGNLEDLCEQFCGAQMDPTKQRKCFSLGHRFHLFDEVNDATLWPREMRDLMLHPLACEQTIDICFLQASCRTGRAQGKIQIYRDFAREHNR